MKISNKKILIFAMTLSFSSLTSAGGSGVGGGATEMTQMLNNSELISQVTTTRNQLEIMLKNLKKLNSYKVNSIDIITNIRQLELLIQRGQALAYNANNLAAQFENRYSDYSEYIVNVRAQNLDETRYQDWSRQGLDNILSALQNANLQSKYFKTEAQRIKEIEHQAATARGRDQLLQASIELASLQSGQMIRLRQLISSDLQMQANYQASLIDRQAEKDAIKVEALRDYDAKDPNPNRYNQRWK